MKTVIDMDGTPLDELSLAWEKIRQKYRTSKNDEYDRRVLDCAVRLAADPGGETAYIWTLGLTVMAPYLTWSPGEGVVQETTVALAAADRELRERPCDHDSHPYRTHDGAEDDMYLAGLLRELADESAAWDEDRPRDEWRCPRNVAGYARIALDIVQPGSVSDVPPRLPVEARDEIATVSALLHGYPKPWTDVHEETASHGWNLSMAEPADRAGRLLVVRAVSWYAVSGMLQKKSPLDDLIEAVEETLPYFADASCDHDWHATLEDSGPDAAETGIILSSPGGRGVYERDRIEYERGAPLERVLCPVYMAEIARETLATLREGRDRLFGPRDTSHLDAEYLRPDGRLEIEKIAERLRHVSWNEPYVDELGLWAARRHERADGRERVVLLLTAAQAMNVSYPGPPLAVAEGVLTLMRAVVAAPRPDNCTHDDAHPVLRDDEFRAGLPYFYAPDEFPSPEGAGSKEAWSCPRFAAEVAEKCASDLDDLFEDEDEDEDEDGEE